jgi:hypothetical protein
MFGFMKGLLSSDKIIEGGMSALDKAILTKEEKLDFKLEFIKATLPMNRARRILAMLVGGVWAIHALTGLGLLLSRSDLFDKFLPYMLNNI